MLYELLFIVIHFLPSAYVSPEKISCSIPLASLTKRVLNTFSLLALLKRGAFSKASALANLGLSLVEFTALSKS